MQKPLIKSEVRTYSRVDIGACAMTTRFLSRQSIRYRLQSARTTLLHCPISRHPGLQSSHRSLRRSGPILKVEGSHKMASASAVVAAPQETSAKVIDGKAISADIRKELKEKLDELHKKFDKSPGLAVVLVGNRGDSETYVRSKKKACEEIGIKSFGTDLPEDVSQEELLKVVEDYNSNEEVHGILVQLPLPEHIDEKRILDAISLEKDVDGFHPFNIGSLALRGREPLFVSCTPKGVIELLDRSGVQISGKKAVVVGRSNIVGMPVALLLTNRDATVTIIHSKTPNAQELCSSADIVVAAIGKPELVKGEWIKEGAAVIDVGTNAVDDATKKRGYRLVGDVDFKEASKKASHITPVPGGVGPMTITMLLSNTVDSATKAFSS